jgi:hypothetical protein
MNEIQIIQSQLATERLHFNEVAGACAAALQAGHFSARRDFAAACAAYFAFAVTRLPGIATSPQVDAPDGEWRQFLQVFNTQATQHFAAIDGLATRNLPVTEWRARSRIDADSIVTERERYARVKAAAP